MKILWNIFWKEKEFKRQIAHLSFGLLYAVGYALGAIDVRVSLAMISATILVSMFLKKRRRFIDRIILMLERENHLFDIPLRGLIFYLLGVTIAISFFDGLPALAGIVVLAVADSIGTLYGKYMGRLKIPWNKDKHMEGPLIGGGLAALLCMSFLPVWVALIAGYAGAVLDTFDLKIKGIVFDDNLLIPVVVAWLVNFMLF